MRPKMETLVRDVGLSQIHDVLLSREDDERRWGAHLEVRPEGPCPCPRCADVAELARDLQRAMTAQKMIGIKVDCGGEHIEVRRVAGSVD